MCASAFADFAFLKDQFKRAVEYISKTSSPDIMCDCVLQPHMDMIRQLELAVENFMRDETQTDFEAFKLKSLIYNKPLIDLTKEIKILRSDVREFDLMDLNFNILGLSISEIKLKAIELFKRISPEELHENIIPVFVNEVAKGYRVNPYHTFTHGFSVCQYFFYMRQISPKLQQIFQLGDLYVGCISSLSHDIGHPGTNNAFQMNTKHQSSRQSLGKSVLEHFHAFTTLHLLETKANMLSTFDKPVKSE